MLCTGPTGSGKSTTLAAFINCILETQKRHILTIEDPIEFEFQHSRSSIIHQRESNAILNPSPQHSGRLWEDPDVIYIGEMRDLETIQLAITAAETGHLVLGTLHTSSAAKTVERIMDVFPVINRSRHAYKSQHPYWGLCLKHYAKTPAGNAL